VTFMAQTEVTTTEGARDARPDKSATVVESSENTRPLFPTEIHQPRPQSAILGNHSAPPHQKDLPLPPVPSLSSPTPPPQHNSHAQWSQTRSPTSAPSNPFYTSPYRTSTPPISSPEQSPLISPAKRFSTGEVKPIFSPGSPRQPLTEEDRVKFTQVPTQPRGS
jgi:hypothetical protein